MEKKILKKARNWAKEWCENNFRIKKQGEKIVVFVEEIGKWKKVKTFPIPLGHRRIFKIHGNLDIMSDELDMIFG